MFLKILIALTVLDIGAIVACWYGWVPNPFHQSIIKSVALALFVGWVSALCVGFPCNQYLLYLIKAHTVFLFFIGFAGSLQVRAEWLHDHLASGKIEPTVDQRDAREKKRLFVLIHGYQGNHKTQMRSIREALKKHGAILPISYPASTLSNADPELVARDVSRLIEEQSKDGGFEEIVVVGHSMGALIARKAFLYAKGGAARRGTKTNKSNATWADKVERIVLLAGMNRGWDISGRRPMDMTWWRYLQWSFGSWFAETTGTGRLIMHAQSGSPFVANLRLEWMAWDRANKSRDIPFVVQLLGDIDDMVSDEDNKDLSATANSASFKFLRVRGTNHSTILDFNDTTVYSGQPRLGEYRRSKFLMAATGTPSDITGENAVQSTQNETKPPQLEDNVKHLVFVVHGIRDYGEWSASFETALSTKYKALHGSDQDLRVASIRYGFFGMGPFLLRSDRQKYVRWLMDEYTETIARYPHLERIDFVGHSNGTYLLASALKRYRLLNVDRVVFGGSVIREDYDWSSLMKPNCETNGETFPAQVEKMRNYVGADDLVVGLLPRVFEPKWMRFLNDDLGSAGFNGFDDKCVDNVKFVTGGHGAFLHHIPAIADFLFAPDAKPDPRDCNAESKYLDARQGADLFWGNVSQYGCQLLWAGAIVALVVIGFWARQFGLPWLAAYIIFVLWFLSNF